MCPPKALASVTPFPAQTPRFSGQTQPSVSLSLKPPVQGEATTPGHHPPTPTVHAPAGFITHSAWRGTRLGWGYIRNSPHFSEPQGGGGGQHRLWSDKDPNSAHAKQLLLKFNQAVAVKSLPDGPGTDHVPSHQRLLFSAGDTGARFSLTSL